MILYLPDLPNAKQEITRLITKSGEVNSQLAGYTLLREKKHTREGRRKMHVSIRIKGHLDSSWQDWLEGLSISHQADGTSLLSGDLKDQAALSGVLLKISHLSLPLLSLESCEIQKNED